VDRDRQRSALSDARQLFAVTSTAGFPEDFVRINLAARLQPREKSAVY